MRVLLVDPPCERFMDFYRFYYPLGLAYLAATLKQGGHEVLILDAEHSPENISQTPGEASAQHKNYLLALENDNHPVWLEIATVIEDFGPDIVGISCLTLKMASALKVAEICRRVRSQAFIILGGDHVTVLPEEGLIQAVDLVIRGEGEEILREVVEAIENNYPPTNIRGTSVRLGNGFHHNPPREHISNIDEIPFPEITALYNLESYRPIDLGIVTTSRGCPYGCTFCGLSQIWGRTIRFRSPLSVISEIDFLMSNFNVDYISFRDGTFQLNRKRVFELCRLLSQRNVRWECLARCDLLDRELLEAIFSAGCVQLRIGIESGSPRMLQKMKKKITLEQIKLSADLLNLTGIYWSAFFMIGLPGEQEEDVCLTKQLIEEIDPPFVTIAKWVPLPGTTMTGEAIREGLLPQKIDWRIASNRNMAGNLFLRESLSLKTISEMTEFVREHNLKHGLRDQRLKS